MDAPRACSLDAIRTEVVQIAKTLQILFTLTVLSAGEANAMSIESYEKTKRSAPSVAELVLSASGNSHDDGQRNDKIPRRRTVFLPAS